MSKFHPIVVFEDHVIFSTRFKDAGNDLNHVSVFDPDFFITPYGYLLPYCSTGLQVLKYLKDPTDENLAEATLFACSFYIIATNGGLYYATILRKSKNKINCFYIPTGPGVKTVLQPDQFNEAGMCLYTAKDYEDFNRLLDATYDPHRHMHRAKISDIVVRMKQKGATINIANCDKTFTEEHFDLSAYK